eukprot:2656289-Rhodomonas_salina.1
MEQFKLTRIYPEIDAKESKEQLVTVEARQQTLLDPRDPRDPRPWTLKTPPRDYRDPGAWRAQVLAPRPELDLDPNPALALALSRFQCLR